jgi:hypothetical protein
VNTLRRNLRDIVRDENGKRDIAKADAIYDELQGKYNHNEAELNRESNRIKKQFADMKITDAESTYIQMLGELRHNPDTELTEDVVKEYYEEHKKNIDEAKVDKAIEEARKLYDDLLLKVNQVLSEQGMKEIPYRQGYFPHFTEPKQNFIQKLFNWKTQDTEIPTSIAGLTEDFKPVKSWQSFDKTRHSDETDYNFLKGLDKVENRHVDIFIGNHVHNNGMLEKVKQINDDFNPFINENDWGTFIRAVRESVLKLINDPNQQS